MVIIEMRDMRALWQYEENEKRIWQRWDDNDEEKDQIAAEREVVWLKAKPLKGRTRMNKISIRSRLIIAILPGLVLMVSFIHLDKRTFIDDDGLTR